MRRLLFLFLLVHLLLCSTSLLLLGCYRPDESADQTARVLEAQTALDQVNFPNYAFDHIVLELAVWKKSPFEG